MYNCNVEKIEFVETITFLVVRIQHYNGPFIFYIGIILYLTLIIIICNLFCLKLYRTIWLFFKKIS